MDALGLNNNNKQYYSFDYVSAHVLTMASEISFNKGLLGFSKCTFGLRPRSKSQRQIKLLLFGGELLSRPNVANPEPS